MEQGALRLARRERCLDGVPVHLPVLGVARLLCESSGRRERGRSREHLGDVPALPADRLHDRRRAMPPAVLSLLLAKWQPDADRRAHDIDVRLREPRYRRSHVRPAVHQHWSSHVGRVARVSAPPARETRDGASGRGHRDPRIDPDGNRRIHAALPREQLRVHAVGPGGDGRPRGVRRRSLGRRDARDDPSILDRDASAPGPIRARAGFGAVGPPANGAPFVQEQITSDRTAVGGTRGCEGGLPMETECRTHTLVADVALFAEGQVLLVRYRDMAKYDNESGWFLPDDELEYLEHPERAGTRILKEQLGFLALKPRLDHIESINGNSAAWHMSFHNRLDLDRMPPLKPSNALAKTEWFELRKLPVRNEVAHHGWALHVLETIAKGQT